ncbi:putative glycerophosphodiester phosphodiesterase [Lupinus albus]|uniref:glycerophosphodiester phosphodiesterase n=1 Tax=Lupinus albus TaxID=3870 RepID=A0A6A4PTZ8_LUPAL|nr:putative glycerophosphodiester phosphodiesterase [Lupinus albus]
MNSVIFFVHRKGSMSLFCKTILPFLKKDDATLECRQLFSLQITLQEYGYYFVTKCIYLTFLNIVEQVVFDHAKERPIIFSTFQPDAASLVKKLQSTYPVFFLTNGGCEIFEDERRNSLEEALKLCLENGLQGIVSEIKGVFRNPGVVTKIKESKISLLTYGSLKYVLSGPIYAMHVNVPEAVYMQHLMGIDGVIVDLVQEITEAVANLITSAMIIDEQGLTEGVEKLQLHSKPNFSQQELSFLLKLIPKLIQI